MRRCFPHKYFIKRGGVITENRKILHCDLNNFFASVELVFRPDLKNVPAAVCGDVTNRHGIILSKNEAAKKFGVKTAETVYSAKSKCPELVLVPAHHDEYIKYSSRVRGIFLEYTDLVEPFGIDEAWLDVTGSEEAFGSAEKIAYEIKDRIKDKLKITASVGVSFNKIFAKIGSDYKKPDAVTVIDENNYKEFLGPMPVESLLFVGNKTKETLKSMNIRTISDLFGVSRNQLIEKLGKYGNTLYDSVWGNSDDAVRSYYEKQDVKSVGNGQTFSRDIKTEAEIKKALLLLSERVSKRLRAEGKVCGCVKVTIKTPGFISFDRQQKMSKCTDITGEIYKKAVEIFEDSWKYPTSVRMLAVTVSALSDGKSGEQLDLFSLEKKAVDEKDILLKNLDRSIDIIRERYGNRAVGFASVAAERVLPDVEMDYGDIE